MKKKITSLKWQCSLGYIVGIAFTLLGSWVSQFNLPVGLLSFAAGIMWYFMAIDARIILIYLALKRDKK